MNMGVNQSLPAEELPTALSKWYTAHSSIRRLWAVEEQEALVVFITLEPTSDGDDAFPTWLAKSHDWAGDLRTRTSREVHLKLIVSGTFEDSYVEPECAMIAQLSWRDPWG